MALFCVLVQVSYLSLFVNIYCSNSHFPVTILGLDLFSGLYLGSLMFLWFPLIENNSV